MQHSLSDNDSMLNAVSILSFRFQHHFSMISALIRYGIFVDITERIRIFILPFFTNLKDCLY